MDRRLLSGVIWMTLLASCSAPTPVSPPQPQPVVTQALAPPPKPALVAPPPPPPPMPITMEGYKKAVALRVAHANPAVFSDPLPEVLKSIVVLDVTIDRDGRLTRVVVQRSNRYKALENEALASVRRAAPFAPPARQIRRNDGSVNFLETFLFREDGQFRIQTLVIAEK